MKPRPKLNPKRPSLGFKIHSGNLAGKGTLEKAWKKVKEHLGAATQPSLLKKLLLGIFFFFSFSSLNFDYL